jgi:hypothetical protein
MLTISEVPAPKTAARHTTIVSELGDLTAVGHSHTQPGETTSGTGSKPMPS